MKSLNFIIYPVNMAYKLENIKLKSFKNLLILTPVFISPAGFVI